MYNFLSKNGQTLAFVGGGLIAILTVFIAMSGIGKLDNPTDEVLFSKGMFDFGLYGAYFLFFLAAAAAIILPLIHIAGNPKGAVKGLIGVGVLLVIFFIAYSMSSGEVTETMRIWKVSSGTGKFIGGAIATSIILFFIAIASALVFSVLGILKNR